MEFLIIKTTHVIGVMVLTACLFTEYFLLDKQLNKKQLKRLAVIDGLYGASAVLVLITGFYIALNLGKGKNFYFDNVSIYIKLGLFIVVGLISI